jgi:hypothetical protein
MPDEYLMLPFVLGGAILVAFLAALGASFGSRRYRRRRTPKTNKDPEN